MLISVGSRSNDAEGSKAPAGWIANHPLGADWGSETDRADVLAFDPDGNGSATFATGIRNCVGLAIHPASGDLYCSTNERDGLGDNLVPDYVTRVHEGAFYGWPWFYIGRNEDPGIQRAHRPRGQGHRPRRAAAAAFGVARTDFYNGTSFPPSIPATALPPSTARGTGRSAPATRLSASG